ncbi:MAG: hypothetical protein PHV16_04055 [Candidatus Nanoarchaeia archaeon]|nr:hypothetical protein [Candidatus Nanoarchaeia archaeon]
MAKSNDNFYVGIKKPKELRKNLLESSKRIIENLKDYEKIMSIRDEKSKKIVEFNEKIGEVVELFSFLKKTFPRQGIQAENKEINKTKKCKKSKKIEIENEEIARLETDLAEIEARLNSM